MPTFTICVRNKRKDGIYSVYIRMVHKSQVQYMKTNYLASERNVRTIYDAKGKPTIEINEKTILQGCWDLIEQYVQKLNIINADIRNMSSREVADYLEEKDMSLSFTEYTCKYIARMINEDRENSAKNDKLMLRNLQRFMGKENIAFNELTSHVVQQWIDTLRYSKRAKSLYPSRMRTIFNTAVREFNDYDHNIIRITVQPFMRVRIPKEDVPEKRSVEIDVLKAFFAAKIDYPANIHGFTYSRREIAHDVSQIIFCLAGINCADLYDMKKTALKQWKLCYNRKKTRSNSSTKAYTEITVPERIRPLFHKYLADNDDEYLLCFHKRYADSNGFVKTIDKTNRLICELLHLPKITTYVLRHSWATIAQNDCGASTELIALALVHSSAHRVTERYIKKNYTPIDIINQQVIKKIYEN